MMIELNWVIRVKGRAMEMVLYKQPFFLFFEQKVHKDVVSKARVIGTTFEVFDH